MNLARLVDIVTPLRIVALMGVIMILYGFVDMDRQNNVLQFMFGIPIMAGALGVHYVVRRATHRNALSIWIIESVLVGGGIYVFLNS